MKKPYTVKRPRKGRTKPCIGSQKPAYVGPPKQSSGGSPLALASSALSNRPPSRN